MTRPGLFKKLITALLVLFFSTTLFAEAFTDTNYGYSFDLPEGYKVADMSDDGTGYMLQHMNCPVELVIKIVNEPKSSSKDVLQSQLKKLNAVSDIEKFNWNLTSCATGYFEMNLGKSFAGWSACAPLTVKDTYIITLCYAPSEESTKYMNFIYSTLNSLCTDMKQYNTPGLIVSAAYPKEGTKPVTIGINNKKISSKIDRSDEEAAQFVVDMEYSVLTLYGKTDMWKEAWQRYYRMIYRDSFGRLETVASDIHDTLWPVALKERPDCPEIYYAQQLLSWVQQMQYYRGQHPSDSDFTALPAMLTGTGNDCDSRSLLVSLLLNSCGIESIMLFSPEYSHALTATLIKAPGQTYTLPGTDLKFLMGETTAAVTWGMIAQEQADRSKWIEVVLP